MGEIFDIRKYRRKNIYDMDEEQLMQLLERTRNEIALMDQNEPEEEDEGAQAWFDRHEQLEDFADEILEILDEI